MSGRAVPDRLRYAPARVLEAHQPGDGLWRQTVFRAEHRGQLSRAQDGRLRDVGGQGVQPTDADQVAMRVRGVRVLWRRARHGRIVQAEHHREPRPRRSPRAKINVLGLCSGTPQSEMDRSGRSRNWRRNTKTAGSEMKLTCGFGGTPPGTGWSTISAALALMVANCGIAGFVSVGTVVACALSGWSDPVAVGLGVGAVADVPVVARMVLWQIINYRTAVNTELRMRRAVTMLRVHYVWPPLVSQVGPSSGRSEPLPRGTPDRTGASSSA